MTEKLSFRGLALQRFKTTKYIDDLKQPLQFQEDIPKAFVNT